MDWLKGKLLYTNLEEDGTEVLHQEEATSNQPVPEGTENPLRRINSTHYNQDNTSLKHENLITLQPRHPESWGTLAVQVTWDSRQLIIVNPLYGSGSKNPLCKKKFF